MRRLVNLCWSLFKWGFALVAIAALVAGGYLYLHLDDEIRRYAQNKLAGHFSHLDVSVGGARFVPGRGVTVFDIDFAEPDQQNGSRPLLHLAELTLAGRFEVQQFIEGSPVIERVIVRRPRLRATRNAAGRWSFEQLLVKPEPGKHSPPVQILGCTLEVIDQTKPHAAPLVLRNADLLVAHLTDGAGRQTSGLQIEGSAEDSLAKQVRIAGTIDPKRGSFDLTASADDLLLSSELLASLPLVPVESLQDVQLQASASFRLTARSAGGEAPVAWDASFQVRGGTLEHPKLPRPLTNLSLAGSCNPGGLAVRSLTAKCGVAEVTAACNRTGWETTAPVALRGRVTELPLDRQLFAALPEQLKKQWRRFKPEGVVDASGTLVFSKGRLQTNATIDCRNLAAEDAERFPYRIHDGSGVLRFSSSGGPTKNGRLAIQLRGLAEGRPLAITADFRGLPCPGQKYAERPRVGPAPPCPVGWVQIDSPRLRVSPAILAALKPHREADMIAKALAPSGDFGLYWRMERTSADARASLAIDLTAHDCGFRYDRFPYALNHLRGKLSARNGVWSFENVEAREVNGPRVVTASGVLQPINGRPVFRMQLTANAALLDDKLRNALPVTYQGIWSQLRPEGRVDLSADVTYAVGDAEPTIGIVASPHQRSVSIEPTFFPYRLSRLDGQFEMRNGAMRFTGGRAEHGRTQMAGDGVWLPSNAPGGDGGWQFRLENLSVDYLDADHDLRLAAPLALRRIIDNLQPEGGFGVYDGRLAFTYDPRTPNLLRTDWDVRLDCHQAAVNFGVRVEGLSGSVRLVGVSNGDDTRSYGELTLDSLFWEGLQLTNVRGPMFSDAIECRLGRGVAEKQPGAPPVEITADAYGGRVAFDTRVLYNTPAEYGSAITVQDIDLDRFSRDWLETEAPLSGRADAQFNMQGKGVSVYGLEGTGAIQVREANLYELPVAVALLKVLRNRAPDTKAFDGCNAEFTLAGEHLNFSRLDLLGDAISLNGRGEASLDKDINLIFHTLVGRGGPSLPFFRSLVGQASEQIMRLRVEGTIDNPLIRRETLPVVGNVLEQLRVDLQPRALTQPAEVPRAAALRRQTR